MTLRSGFTLGDWTVHPLEGRLVCDDDEQRIQPKSMDVLLCLANADGAVVERDKLLLEVWGERAQSDEPLTRCIGELRKALGESGAESAYILTVPKRGYQLLKPVAPLHREKAAADEQTTPKLSESQSQKRLGTAKKVVAAVAVLLLAAVFEVAIERALDDRDTNAPGELEVIDNSIAVLPFLNLSASEEQEYFSDGISEELLILLARVPGLRVISRSSAFSYKGRNVDLQTIARELRVSHILEGSVRRSGDRVRITAQLIDTQTDAHVWSDIYERSLDDIFATQDEIASRVVAELKVALLGDIANGEATDPQAYALLLQARHVRKRANADSYAQAVVLLQRALDIDPDFAPAWTLLASTYSNQTNIGQLASNEGYAMAREAAEEALAIDPGYGPAHDLIGWIAMNHDHDLAEAARHVQRALELEPRDTAIIGTAATLLSFLGRQEEAVVLHEYVVSRNPVDAISHMNLGVHYLRADRFNDALDAIRTALRLSPEYNGAHYRIGLALLFKGEPEAALEAFAQEDTDEEYRVKGLALAFHALDRAPDFQVKLTELIDGWGERWPAEIAHVYAWAGNTEAAIAWLEKEFDMNRSIAPNSDGPYFYLPLNGNQRFMELLELSGNLPAQLNAIEFEVSIPE